MTSPGRIAFNDCDLCQIVFHVVCPKLTAIVQCLITKARKKRRVHLAALLCPATGDRNLEPKLAFCPR